MVIEERMSSIDLTGERACCALFSGRNRYIWLVCLGILGLVLNLYVE